MRWLCRGESRRSTLLRHSQVLAETKAVLRGYCCRVLASVHRVTNNLVVTTKQVNYLVFPGTSGAPYIDYLLADRHVSDSLRGSVVQGLVRVSILRYSTRATTA